MGDLSMVRPPLSVWGRVAVAVLLLFSTMIAGCVTVGDSGSGLEVVASARSPRSATPAGVVLEGGAGVLAADEILVLQGRRLVTAARLPEACYPPFSAGTETRRRAVVQPWDGAFVAVRPTASHDEGTDDSSEPLVREQLVLVRIDGMAVETEVLLEVYGIEDVALLSAPDSAIVVCVSFEPSGAQRTLTGFRMTPAGEVRPWREPEAFLGPIDLAVAEESGEALLGVLVNSAETYPPETDESELRVLGMDGGVHSVSTVPFGSRLVGPHRDVDGLSWLVEATSDYSEAGEWREREPTLALVSGSSTRVYGVETAGWPVDLTTPLAVGDFVAERHGDEILVLTQEWEPGDGIRFPVRTSLAVGWLADGGLHHVEQVEDGASEVTVVDIDSDGHLDIVAVLPEEHPNPCGCTQSAYSVAVYMGRDDGSFGPPLRSRVYDLLNAFDVVDLDGDGVGEVVVGHARGNACSQPQGQRIDVLRIADSVVSR